MRVIIDADPETGMGVSPYSRQAAQAMRRGYSFYREARIDKGLYDRYVTALSTLNAIKDELGKIWEASAPTVGEKQ